MWLYANQHYQSKLHLFSHSTRIAWKTAPPIHLKSCCHSAGHERLSSKQVWLLNELKKHEHASDSLLCADRAASLTGLRILWYGLMDSLNMDPVFWRRACEDLMDIWFGCRYIFLQSPIGEITGFKCRLLLSAVPVHYLKKKKSTVEECRALREIDTLCIPTISLYYNGSYLHDLEVQEEIHFINEFRRLFHHKWSWHEWQHLRGSNIVPFPLM